MQKEQKDLYDVLDSFSKLGLKEAYDAPEKKILSESKEPKPELGSLRRHITIENLDSEVIEAARQQAEEAIKIEQSVSASKNSNGKRHHRRSNVQHADFYGNMGSWSSTVVSQDSSLPSVESDKLQEAGQQTEETHEPAAKRARHMSIARG